MKRLLPLALALLLLLSACATPPSTEIPSVTTGRETEAVTESSKESKEPPYAFEVDDTGTITVNGIKLYQAFIAQTELPENFIYFEKLADYGGFSSLVYEEEKESYSYSITTTGRKYMTITFIPNTRPPKDTAPVIEDKAEDLGTVDAEKGACRMIGNIRYLYFNGKLTSIRIPLTHYYAHISAYDGLNSGAEGFRDTRLEGLLTRSTAEAAAKALLAKIEK